MKVEVKNKRYFNNQSFKDSLPNKKLSINRPQSSDNKNSRFKKESGMTFYSENTHNNTLNPTNEKNLEKYISNASFDSQDIMNIMEPSIEILVHCPKKSL